MSGTIESRLGLAKAAVAMAKTAPVFGVGLGRFYELSGDFAPRVIFILINNGKPGENAHNNFLQVLAEQGVVGFAILGLTLAVLLFPAIKQERAAPNSTQLWLIVGLCGGLLTWISGHPLLVNEFAFVFWSYAALLASLTPAPAQPRWQWGALACATLIAVSGPVRGVQQLRLAWLEHIGVGLSQWEHDREVPYRRTGGRFSLYLPVQGGYVTLPVQRIDGAPDPAILQIWRDGRLAGDETLGGSEWHSLRLLMPSEKRQFALFDFVVIAPGGSSPLSGDVLRVGKAQAK
jgi:hypothetical protein